ncbi:MAG: 2-oxoglutarate dehydrogenase complex dihydrolipoyllysine-residue succinyltransferase [Trichloromonadaceae bacterium]
MEIKVPPVGESIFEAVIASWNKQDGDHVAKDELLCELETDKVNVELNAEAAGTLSIQVAAGTTVKIGSVIGSIDESAAAPAPTPKATEPAATPPPPKPATPTAAAAVNPAARKLAQEQGVDPATLTGSGKKGRVLVEDVQSAKAAPQPPAAPAVQPRPPNPESTKVAPAVKTSDDRSTREPMSPMRKRIAERLVSVRQTTAMLTTFNEADMSRVLDLRRRQQEHFQARHGIKLGLMSFFVKASVEALKEFPLVNARIDGDDIVQQHFYDIGIAVASERGLVVPVLRNADSLSFAEIEQGIAALAEKVQTRKITIADLEGGTFTISNGGIYGNLLSTPMLNPPQCGILGMHTILERPVARDGTVVIRPMMNLALSYDHRLIDGREAVGFLKRIKACIEDPEELLLEQ